MSPVEHSPGPEACLGMISEVHASGLPGQGSISHSAAGSDAAISRKSLLGQLPNRAVPCRRTAVPSGCDV